METIEETKAVLPPGSGKSRPTVKTLAMRLLVIWFLLGQMVLVCMPARTTKPLCRLESVYASRPSLANKTALDNEFERIANFESQRAIGRFALLLLADVVVIAFCWNVGTRQKRQRNPLGLPSPAFAPQGSN